MVVVQALTLIIVQQSSLHRAPGSGLPDESGIYTRLASSRIHTAISFSPRFPHR